MKRIVKIKKKTKTNHFQNVSGNAKNNDNETKQNKIGIQKMNNNNNIMMVDNGNRRKKPQYTFYDYYFFVQVILLAKYESLNLLTVRLQQRMF